MFLMEPKWTRFPSKDLDAVAYVTSGKRLLIRFRSGAIYEYADVPALIYEELLASPSKDGYFSEYIRPDYTYRRVRGAEGIPAV